MCYEQIYKELVNMLPNGLIATELYQLSCKYGFLLINGRYILTMPIPDKRYNKGYRMERIINTESPETFLQLVKEHFNI